MAENDDNKIDDDESRLTPRQGLARIAPISVVEISCRDVPLGTALTLALNRYLESSNRFCVRTTVVDMMKPYICSSGVHGNDKGSKVPSFVCRICAFVIIAVESRVQRQGRVFPGFDTSTNRCVQAMVEHSLP